MKKFTFIVSLFLIHHLLIAQHDLYLGGELIGGVLVGNNLDKNILGQKNYSPTVGGQLNVSFRMFDVVAIEAGIGQHWNNTRLRDNEFKDELQDFSINIENTYMNWNYYAALSAFFKIKNTDSYLYSKLAFSQNIYSAATVKEASFFEISTLNVDRLIEYSTTYKASNLSIIPEIGIQHKFYKGNLLNLGIRYNIGQSQVLESNYTATDNNTQEVKSDELNSTGNSFALTLGFHYRLRHFDKKEKVKKLRIDDYALDVSKKQPIVDTARVDTTPPNAISNRKLIIIDKIIVHTAKVKILIWDHQTVDGDRVSLNLNGAWILKNYELKKDKYEMIVELQEGLNTFVLHALNLGRISPNTAALIVDDGEEKHRLTLQSNLKESGTLQIKFKKKKNGQK